MSGCGSSPPCSHIAVAKRRTRGSESVSHSYETNTSPTRTHELSYTLRRYQSKLRQRVPTHQKRTKRCLIASSLQMSITSYSAVNHCTTIAEKDTRPVPALLFFSVGRSPCFGSQQRRQSLSPFASPLPDGPYPSSCFNFFSIPLHLSHQTDGCPSPSSMKAHAMLLVHLA